MVHLKSIWELSWSPFGVCFGSSGVYFGVHFESMLRFDGDFGRRSPRDQISKALGPILALLLDPKLAPCWLHVGGGRAFLGRSKGHLEFNFDQHGKEDEKERLDFQKTFKTDCFFNDF